MPLKFVIHGKPVGDGFLFWCPICGMRRIAGHPVETHFCGLAETPKHENSKVSVFKKAANFATSAARHIAAGAPQATDEQVAVRFAICQGCEHFDGKACKKCGCPVVREKKFLSKLSWANEKCPVGKWGPVSS